MSKKVEMDGYIFHIPWDRVLVDVWDGQPVTRPMSVYEKFIYNSKAIPNATIIDEETFNLGLALLGDRNGLKTIMSIDIKK